MAHGDIFEIFKEFMPMWASNVAEWFPNGKNSIRVRIREVSVEFVFTFVNLKEWRFETLDSFINNTLIKKENK